VHEGYLARTPDGYVLGERVDALAAGAPLPGRAALPGRAEHAPGLVALPGGK
jgi:hypothetical protein